VSNEKVGGAGVESNKTTIDLETTILLSNFPFPRLDPAVLYAASAAYLSDTFARAR